MNKRIISDYLESLREDDELDYIFPLLLESMGFRIVTTPKNSKGQPQYGKDVVAIGKDTDGTMCKWYFELKGNAAKDINDNSFSVQDGVRDSILAALDVDYKAFSIPHFDSYPTKIVFVHNGVLKENMRCHFEGFISKTFKNRPKKFERWGIWELTDLFYTHLFDECLFRDEKSYRLVKKILTLSDSEGWVPTDVEILIDELLSNCSSSRLNRTTVRNFAAINLLLAILLKDGHNGGNLLPAKRAAEIAVLKSWAWILKHSFYDKPKVLKIFSKISNLLITIYDQYLQKCLPLAMRYKGLYMIQGHLTEKVFYPLRCYDFLKDMLYFFFVVNIRLSIENIVKNKEAKFEPQGLDLIWTVVNQNTGFDLPLLDTHSIPLSLLFVITKMSDDKRYIDNFKGLISRIVTNIILRKEELNMFPELYGNRKAVIRSMFQKDSSYQDSSSLFLLVIMEFIAYFDMSEEYERLRDVIEENNTDLQFAIPNPDVEDLEVKLFSNHLHEEIGIERFKLPKTLEEFKQEYKKRYEPIPLKTDKSPFFYLTILAHLYYESDWFPDFINLGYLAPMHEASSENISCQENYR